jgi:hypothetical protein
MKRIRSGCAYMVHNIYVYALRGTYISLISIKSTQYNVVSYYVALNVLILNSFFVFLLLVRAYNADEPGVAFKMLI